MTQYYFDHSAVGNEYQSYAATPTWGALSTDKPLPMDGTGLAGPSHAAAVAIAEIQITVLPADTNTLTIAGAVLTAKTTAAAKNQWTITGAISTCVTNLVALINTFGTGTSQCDAAVNSGTSALLLALPYWQFARVKPGTTDTLQIATRLAGNDLNHAVNSNVAISSSGWGTPPTLTQFAGGANGPFGYFFSTATVFGKTTGTYGVALAAAPGPSNPSYLTDVIHGRTRRSGADLTLTNTVTGSWTVTWQNRNWLFDDGTIWSGDNGKFTLKHQHNNGAWITHYYAIASGGFVCFESRSHGKFEIVAEVLAPATGNNRFIQMAQQAAGSSYFSFINSRFIHGANHANAANTAIILFGDGNATASSQFADLTNSYCEVSSNNAYVGGQSGSASSNCSIIANGLQVKVMGATGPIGTVLYSSNTGGRSKSVTWIGGSIKDSNGIYTCANPIGMDVTQENGSILIDSVDGVTDPSIAWTAGLGNGGSVLRWNQSEGSNKGYRILTNSFGIDWRGNGTFPYTTAADLRGNLWSHRVSWTSAPTAFHHVTPVRLSRFYRGTTGTKTVTLDLYVPDATTFYLDELQMIVTYVDSTDVIRTESVGGARGARFATRTALSAGSATWTASGVAAHSGKKMNLTTAQQVKSGTEIVVSLGLCASRSPTITFYVSPELVLT